MDEQQRPEYPKPLWWLREKRRQAAEMLRARLGGDPRRQLHTDPRQWRPE